MAEKATTKPRKKRLQSKAWIEVDYCSGCEACVDVCPVECIDVIDRLEPSQYHQYDKACTIDIDRCTGCRLCWELCPWDCIVMVEADAIGLSLEARAAEQVAAATAP